MAIYIQINKAAESPSDLTYEFGPAEGIVGRALWSKDTGELSLLDIDSPSRAEFYLSRVRSVLARHHAAGEYPDRTHYAA